MEPRRSMNTSLRNARIFDDDSWDSVSAGIGLVVKEESMSNDFDERLIKIEPGMHIKQEIFDEDSNFPVSTQDFDKIHIKQENTTPVKWEDDSNSNSNSKRNFKWTHTNLFKQRQSPYKLPSEKGATVKVSSFKLEEALKQNIVTDKSDEKKNPTMITKVKKKIEPETDPLVLERRQKQIDFGKNTICYDNYRKLVSKNKRAKDDPQTPDKFTKYSRRGWDGLIKQWRLQLHKYDPTD